MPSVECFAAWQKLSTYTCSSFVGVSEHARRGTSAIWMRSYTGSCGNGTAWSTKCCVRSLADSMTAQNSPGLSTQPICIAAGMIRRIGSPASCRSTYAKLQQPSSCTTRCQNPSLMSNLQKRMCRPAGVSHMYWRSCGSTLPISLTNIGGALRTIVSLTLFCVTVATLSTSW